MALLMNVPIGTWFKVTIPDAEPHGAAEVKAGMILRLSKWNGKYAFCFDREGRTFHPSMWTEVQIVMYPVDPDLGKLP